VLASAGLAADRLLPPPSEVSLATVLSTAGYATQAIGKWHCGDQPEFQPTNHGFDNYLGLPYSNDMGRQAGKPDFMPEMPPLPLIVDGKVVEQQPDQASLTDRYVAAALEFMRSNAEQPFFLYLAHMYVHVPIYVQPRFLEESTNGPYGAAVASIDWATEVLLAELDALGLADNTIVIFTSDNGSLGDGPPPWGSTEPLGGSNGMLRGAKATTWEGGQRVPGIVRWPARVPPGRTCDEIVSAMDLYPTLAAVCGAERPFVRVAGSFISRRRGPSCGRCMTLMPTLVNHVTCSVGILKSFVGLRGSPKQLAPPWAMHASVSPGQRSAPRAEYRTPLP